MYGGSVLKEVPEAREKRLTGKLVLWDIWSNSEHTGCFGVQSEASRNKT